jgi:hypothetical protein
MAIIDRGCIRFAIAVTSVTSVTSVTRVTAVTCDTPVTGDMWATNIRIMANCAVNQPAGKDRATANVTAGLNRAGRVIWRLDDTT